MKKKNLAFTLAEVLIVIGIIGVVAALTLPNLNHATGDKETVTRLKKAYSVLSEAQDRMIAIYGPMSSWPEECRQDLCNCWMKRIGEFLKISKSCNETESAIDNGSNISCEFFHKGDMTPNDIVYQLADGLSFSADSFSDDCSYGSDWKSLFDICIEYVNVDVDGPNKGKNKYSNDIFEFQVSNSLGIIEYSSFSSFNNAVSRCMSGKEYECTFWPLEYGNLDYLKADRTGKCNDSNIILDGVTNTSCH